LVAPGRFAVPLRSPAGWDVRLRRTCETWSHPWVRLHTVALYTDGAEILYDYAETIGDSPEVRSARELAVVRHGQRVFAEVLQDYLHRIVYAPDGYAD
jgi:hypothetical protein